MKAVVMKEVGGTDVMEFLDWPEPVARPGHVVVEVAAAGVNFMDIGVRQGMAWTDIPNPKVLGVEGAGRVLAVGDGADEFEVGDRVAWVYAPGSYAQRQSVPTASLVKIPDTVDDRTAASAMMQGLTASHFATDFYPVQPGDIALVHAAAGGVGLLLTQIIRLRGGRVIGRVSSEDKVAIAKKAGAEHVIVDTEGQFADEVLRLTGGEGVNVVYDGSGPKTFKGSIEALRRSGTFCWYGPVLGGPGPLDIMSLPKSIKIGYATFMDHIRTRKLLLDRTKQLFDWIGDGTIKVTIGETYRLADAARAHAAMASRTTTGKLLLIP
ncbi:quinone oxidoreductase family protein [Sinorhizobium meliloti]|uniref:quinone oxidoreductase family protein n=1 Tax=Rhizobium meliloti TaxID=382 RepID=UPI00398D2FC8